MNAIKETLADLIYWVDENGVEKQGRLLCIHQTMLVEVQVKSIPGNHITSPDAAAYVKCGNEVKIIPASWIKFLVG